MIRVNIFSNIQKYVVAPIEFFTQQQLTLHLK